MNYAKVQRYSRNREFTPLNRRKEPWWDRHGEEIGMLLWCLAITLGGAMLVLALNGCESVFR